MLRYGVLGLLIERRGYGYELVQRLSARLGPAWQLNRSAVYTALDQLLDDGLIQLAPREPRARAGGRVVYEATEAGVCEYEAWLARPSERIEPIRSELALKVAFATADSAPRLLSAIDRRERLVEQALRDEAVTLPAVAATLRLRSELDWLQVVREALHGMVGEAPASADPSANGSPALRAGNAD